MEHEHLEALYPDTSRFPEIAQLLSFIKEGNSCQMIAAPGVGRGNVCKFLAYNHNIRVKHLGDAQVQYHFVFVNFAEVKKRPLADILKFIFLALVSSLHERRLDDAFTTIDRMFKESLQYRDELVLFEGLKKAIDYLVYEKNLHIIFLFERFETYLPQVTEAFFINLRSLRDRAKYKFSVVFSVTRPLEETIEASLMADFYEFFADHHAYLTLCDMPGIMFRIHYLETITGKKITDPVLQHILLLTAGHGKLTRLSTEAVLATPEKIVSLEDFLLSQKTMQSALKEIWDFFTPAEQRQILARQFINNESVDLEKTGLITDKGITIPLLSLYIASLDTPLPQAKESIVYDPLTNVIKKGSVVISEQLTSSEFKLLKLLIEHAGQILDREAIISAVWKEGASTNGVSDQALDQLIFRLRKKIEDDPNNPQHIQTVKGRGLKFM